MGLDMYLRQREFFSDYLFSRDSADPKVQEEAKKFERLAECVKAVPSKDSPMIIVDTTVAYWRKANAIHGWFVNELAGGKDECQEIEVTRKNLEDLLTLCREAVEKMKEDPGVIPEGPLEPTPGFFFGSTDDPEYYREDLEGTIKKIEEVLKNSGTAPDAKLWEMPLFIYQASW